MIDRTATFVARSANPPQFEDKIRENQRQDPKFSFLNPADPYHAYYRHKMTRIAQGEEVEVVPEKEKSKEPEAETEVKKGPLAVEPPPTEFVLDVPPVNATDM